MFGGHAMKMNENIAQLFERMAQRDPAAMGECIDQYQGLVRSLARQFLRNGQSQSIDHAEVEDVVQDVFVTVWNNAHRFDRTRGSESTFIGTIARRNLINRYRRRRRSNRRRRA